MVTLDGLGALLLGLVIGSFLNVCISRVPKRRSIISPGSRCPQCEAPIRWWRNIPVLSYLLLRGRCAACGQPIGIRYPIVELLTGGVYVLAFSVFGWSLAFVVNAVFFSLLIALVVIDLNERLLPDLLTLNGTLAGFLVAPLQSPAVLNPIEMTQWPAVNAWLASAVGIVAGAGILWLVAAFYLWLRRVEGLGFGDVKLMAMIGAFLGWQGAWLTVFAGSLAGAVVGSLYIYLSASGRQYELPFGTFLGLCAIVVALYGRSIVTWYAGMM